MYPDLQTFIAALEAAGELKRIAARVSPVLEIAQWADAESKAAAPAPPSRATRAIDPRFHSRGGHALLFENVEGSNIPVLINALGSYRRIEMALGCGENGRGGLAGGGLEALAARIGDLAKPAPPRSFEEVIDAAKKFLPLVRIPPKRRVGGGRGASQEVVHTGSAIDLTTLPLLRCWPHDGDYAALGYPANVNAGVAGVASGPDWDAHYRGRYITLAGIHTIHADDIDDEKPASHNIGMYRVQLLGPKTLAMHWHMHHDGARHWRSWKALGKPMPVAIALGGESVLPYAATAPLPPGISELLLAGFLNGNGIRMVRGVTVPLWVPANAEIIIEGFVRHDAGFIGWDPRDPAAGPLGPGAAFEGPFGDHTGFYSMPDRYPLLEVTAITHRAKPIYPTTIVGLPPQEDYYLGKATERLFLPLLKTIVHDIEDYDLPQFGAFHNAACVKIKKAYPLQGRRVMHSVWGAGQMAWTKTIFVVDDDCHVHDTFEVLKRAGQYCEPSRDIEFARGPVDILDHAAPRLGAGLKVGFDCTRKRAGEEVGGVGGVEITGTPRAIAPRDELDAHAAKIVAEVEGISGRRVLDARVLHETGGYWMVIKVDKKPGDAAAAGAGVRALEAAMRVPEPVVAGRGGGPAYFVAVGPDVDIADADAALFHWVANFDASRDLVLDPVELERAAPDSPAPNKNPFSRLTHRIGLDATPKVPGDERFGEPVRAWPPVLKMDEGVIAKVGGMRR